MYTRAYESNGAWWPHIASRTLWSLLVGHATLAALLALKLGGGDPGQGRATALLAGPALLPLPLAVAAAFHHHSTRFAPIFARVPLSCAAQMDEADGADGGSGIDRFARAYEAPCSASPTAQRACARDCV